MFNFYNIELTAFLAHIEISRGTPLKKIREITRKSNRFLSKDPIIVVYD